MARRKNQRVNQKTLNQAKVLLEAGMSQVQTADICNISTATLWKMKQAGFDWGEYKKVHYKSKPHTNGKAIARKTNESSVLTELKAINSNLEVLVNAWNSSGKRRLF